MVTDSTVRSGVMMMMMVIRLLCESPTLVIVAPMPDTPISASQTLLDLISSVFFLIYFF